MVCYSILEIWNTKLKTCTYEHYSLNHGYVYTMVATKKVPIPSMLLCSLKNDASDTSHEKYPVEDS
jgi:hypothetical protein